MDVASSHCAVEIQTCRNNFAHLCKFKCRYGTVPSSSPPKSKQSLSDLRIDSKYRVSFWFCKNVKVKTKLSVSKMLKAGTEDVSQENGTIRQNSSNILDNTGNLLGGFGFYQKRLYLIS